ARLRVTTAAHEVAAALHQTRLSALRLNAHVGLRFTRRDGRIHWAVYADGDGDGVRTRDIRRGIDPPLRAPIPLRRMGASVHPGFPDGRLPRAPGGRGRLGRRTDPLRFGRSDIVSFGPLGTSTSGTLYMTDGAHWTAAVRVYGTTGKIRVIVYDPETETWS
ncbi:MAG: GspH/FimT family pseudopilin, partial [Acidobacteriota bacterium]